MSKVHGNGVTYFPSRMATRGRHTRPNEGCFTCVEPMAGDGSFYSNTGLSGGHCDSTKALFPTVLFKSRIVINEEVARVYGTEILHIFYISVQWYRIAKRNPDKSHGGSHSYGIASHQKWQHDDIALKNQTFNRIFIVVRNEYQILKYIRQ